MESSKNRLWFTPLKKFSRWFIPLKKFSRLRVNLAQNFNLDEMLQENGMMSPNMKLTIGGNNAVMVSPEGKMRNGTAQNFSNKQPNRPQTMEQKKAANIIPAKVPAVSVQSVDVMAANNSTVMEPKPEIG